MYAKLIKSLQNKAKTPQDIALLLKKRLIYCIKVISLHKISCISA